MAAGEVLKQLGFSKLAPVLAAFFILLAFNVFWGTVTAVGNALPPYVSPSTKNWIVENSSRNSDLLCLWANYGDAPSPERLQIEIEQTTSEAREVHKDSPRLENIDYWLKQEGKASEAWVACKFFLFWSVLCAIAEAFAARAFAKAVVKLFVCVLFFSTAGTAFIFSYIHSAEAVEYAQISAAEAFLVPKGVSCSSVSAIQKAGFNEIISQAGKEEADSMSRGWWTFSWFDSQYFRWVWNQEFHREKNQ
jgi:hypothetical protein